MGEFAKEVRLIFERVKLNLNVIIKTTMKISGALFGLIAIFLSFISWEDIGVNSICYRIGLLVGMIILALFTSIIYVVFIKRSCTIWKCGNAEITVCYSDILKKGFAKTIRKDRIIVIPVNTCFDTIIDSDISIVEKPLISPNSIHAQWIKKMNDCGISPNDIDMKIQEYIAEKDIQPVYELQKSKKRRGKLLSYERGTVIAVKGSENVTFFLLALAELDENNRGQCPKDEFVASLKSLIEFYDNNGQGFEMYLPLMGTNLSRVGMSHPEALHKIKAVFDLYNDKIHGKVNIVIYNNDKKEVSIFE